MHPARWCQRSPASGRAASGCGRAARSPRWTRQSRTRQARATRASAPRRAGSTDEQAGAHQPEQEPPVPWSDLVSHRQRVASDGSPRRPSSTGDEEHRREQREQRPRDARFGPRLRSRPGNQRRQRDHQQRQCRQDVDASLAGREREEEQDQHHARRAAATMRASPRRIRRHHAGSAHGSASTSGNQAQGITSTR